MANVELSHVSKRFGTVVAVDDVNLDINDQEFLVLLGPSGCGKTTTLRMVAGLESVSEGTIRIGSRDVTDVAPKDRDIAMVFQNYALYPHMTVYDNMAFGLKLHKVSKTDIAKRVNDVASILGLESLLKRRPKELSGGQRQRVALGRAIVREPAAFLMDEPLSNLDAKLRAQMRVELKRLHQRLGATILYVTHDQTEAMTMGTRIVVMKDGVIQQVDTPDGIYRRPINKFVAAFVGTPSMNFLDGDVGRDGDDVTVHTEGHQIVVPKAFARALESADTPQITLGIRPEDVHVSSGDLPADQLPIPGVIRVVEPLGYEKMVYCEVGDVTVVARTENAWTGNVGDKVTLGVSAGNIHVFSQETEQAIR